MTSTTVQDHCKVGDPDPTPRRITSSVGAGCPSEIPGGALGFICTREAGHGGQHVAGTGEVVVAVWPAQSTQDGEQA
jgi:hypothetical protein